MKKIVVVSDSHGDSKKIGRIIKAEAPFDILVHSGDGVTDLRKAQLPEGVAVFSVLGNVDVSNGIDGDRLAVEEIGNFTFMMAHGDQFDVKNGLEIIKEEAGRFSADVVIFGHIHQQILKESRPALFNPGNASNGFYGIIELSDRIYFTHRKLSDS